MEELLFSCPSLPAMVRCILHLLALSEHRDSESHILCCFEEVSNFHVVSGTANSFGFNIPPAHLQNVQLLHPNKS